MRFINDKQRRAVFAQMNSSSSMIGLHGIASVNRFSYPPANVLSAPPKYVYDSGFVNQFSEDPKLGDGSAKNTRKSELHFYPDPGIYDDEKHHLEVLRKGGIVYMTPPDSPEEFKKYEDEMRRKLDKKKFATDEKKLKQANLSGELLDEDVYNQALGRLGYATDDVDGDRQGDIKRDVRNEMYKIKKEQDSFGKVQVHFGDSYKPGRRVRKFAKKSFEEMRELNKERIALMSEINNSTDLSRDRRNEIVKRLDYINDILEGAN
jgi:hypothetical protein